MLKMSLKKYKIDTINTTDIKTEDIPGWTSKFVNLKMFSLPSSHNNGLL